ncbi:hypothetical protein SGLAD_v1c07010 [Spiroplasma gladiatoris]|uniref:Uncharacterized protein n=1 Tax=Spiroplasma gladiatoris TaxID=2143 RepID=A0A4P7AK14_9MOLU|nr:hypothetical protein [Spiroplasma gladiatoris]QBQ07900.1 hypothetical protein SGLAD_v1c07010 [Spiroplasma gladiatoris]
MFLNKINDKDHVWNKVGAEMIQTYGLINNIKTSHQEIYDFLHDDEFENETVDQQFEPEIINAAKAWNYIKIFVTKLRLNQDINEKNIGDCTLEEIIKVYKYLDPNLTFVSTFIDTSKDHKNLLDYYKNMCSRIFKELSVEAVLEELALWHIRLSVEKALGCFTEVFSIMIVNGLLIYKNIAPISFELRTWDIEDIIKVHHNLVDEVSNIPFTQWSNLPTFKYYLGLWIHNCESLSDASFENKNFK